MARIGLVSDIHLSRARPWFHANWELLLTKLAQAAPPDMFTIIGGCALDAPARPDDLTFARAQFEWLPAPWHALPGSHDIGACRPEGAGEALASEALAGEALAPEWTRHIANWLRAGGIGLYAPPAGHGVPYPHPPTYGE